jgi:hypothetical protein
MKNYLKPLCKLSFCIAFATVSSAIISQEIITQGFDRGLILDLGWSTTIIDTTSTETSSGIKIPALKFANTGQSLETPEFDKATDLSFWAKGALTDSLSALVIKYNDGSEWKLLDSITNLSRSEQIYTYPLPEGTIKIKFTYYKSVGNLYIDDICISKPTDPPLLIADKTRLIKSSDYNAIVSYAAESTGKIFYLVTNENCAKPSVNEIINPPDYSSICKVDFGSIEIKDTSLGYISILGLTPEMNYKAFLLPTGSKNNINNSTIITEIGFKTIKKQNDLFFSKIIKGSGYNKAIEIYNPGNDSVLLDNYRIISSTNGAGWKTSYFNFKKGARLPGNETYVLMKNSADSLLLDFKKANELLSSSMLDFTGNDARGLQRTTNNGKTWFLVDIFGNPEDATSFTIAGVSLAAQKYNLWRKSSVADGNINWEQSSGADSLSSEWLLKPLDNYSEIGYHVYVEPDSNNIDTSNSNNYIKLVMGVIEFEGQIGKAIVDSGKHTIKVNIEDGIDISDISWECSIDKTIIVSPDIENTNNFSKPVSFKLLSNDRRDSTIWTISLVVAKPYKIENSRTIGLSIWPNPATDWLSFNLPENCGQLTKIKIVDYSGRVSKIYHTNSIINHCLLLSGILDGIYMIEFYSSYNQIVKTTFIKQGRIAK